MAALGDKRADKLLLVLIWVSATLAGGAVTWSAVARLGHEAAAGAGTTVSQADVRRQLAQLSASPSTQPTPHGPTSTAPSTPPGTPPANSPTRHVRSWNLSGGHVTATCRGAVISGYATPLDGWSMQLDETGPATLKVEFSRGDSDVELEAVCSAGIPTATSS